MRSLFAKPVPDFNLVKDKLPPVFFNRLTTYRLKQVEREGGRAYPLLVTAAARVSGIPSDVSKQVTPVATYIDYPSPPPMTL